MEYRGRSIVLAIYCTMIVVAAGFGYLLGAVILPRTVDGPLPRAELGPVTFPITPLTLAVYGSVSIGVALGVALLAVVYVSRRYDDRKPTRT